MEERDNCIEEIATLEEVDVITTGAGTSNYNDLENKPSINDIVLEGNKTLEELNIQPAGDYALKSEIPDISELSAEVDSNTREIGFLDTRVTKLEEEPSDDYATEEYVNGKVQELVDGDIANLTELIKEDQDNIKTLQKTDIDRFDTSKPSGDGLLTINAVTKNNQNIQAFNIYNGLDAKYPYAAVGTQSAKELDERLKVLEESGSSGDIPIYYYDGNASSEDNKATFDKICMLIDNNKPFILEYGANNKLVCTRYRKSSENYYNFFFDLRELTMTRSDYKLEYEKIQPYSVSYDKSSRQILLGSENASITLRQASLNQLVGKDNTTSWTPSSDYGLVHKKYVDDLVASSGGGGDVPIYYFDGDVESEENKKMFDEIVALHDEGKPFDIRMKYTPDKVYFYTIALNACYKLSTSYYFVFVRISQENTNLRGTVCHKMDIITVTYYSPTRTISTISGATYGVNPDDIIGKNNTTYWVPTSDYNPTSKKYVDDKIAQLEAKIQQLQTANLSNKTDNEW